MKVATDNEKMPSACSAETITGGHLAIDKDLQIRQVDWAAAEMTSLAKDALLCFPIEDLVGLPIKLRTLRAPLATAVQAEALDSQAKSNGRTSCRPLSMRPTMPSRSGSPC